MGGSDFFYFTDAFPIWQFKHKTVQVFNILLDKLCAFCFCVERDVFGVALDNLAGKETTVMLVKPQVTI